MNLTSDMRFESTSKEVCKDDLVKVSIVIALFIYLFIHLFVYIRNVNQQLDYIKESDVAPW